MNWVLWTEEAFEISMSDNKSVFFLARPLILVPLIDESLRAAIILSTNINAETMF
ncbi:hypothetical protein [Paenibacillus sp. GXUN7292]|uniref:hypothetical protein n=1 Tax=Paenibacillus sp. GXUN7292 TaxID=3422499 RepID=UPI003D7C5E8A